MNSRQRRFKAHRQRLRIRRQAKRILKSQWAGPMDKLLALLTLSPDAFKPNPAYNWWKTDPANKP